jgi:hypothetical protein
MVLASARSGTLGLRVHQLDVEAAVANILRVRPLPIVPPPHGHLLHAPRHPVDPR